MAFLNSMGPVGFLNWLELHGISGFAWTPWNDNTLDCRPKLGLIDLAGIPWLTNWAGLFWTALLTWLGCCTEQILTAPVNCAGMLNSLMAQGTTIVKYLEDKASLRILFCQQVLKNVFWSLSGEKINFFQTLISKWKHSCVRIPQLVLAHRDRKCLLRCFLGYKFSLWEPWFPVGIWLISNGHQLVQDQPTHHQTYRCKIQHFTMYVLVHVIFHTGTLIMLSRNDRGVLVLIVKK